MDNILKELQEIKNLTLLGAKQALTMNDAALFTGLSKSHLYKLVCFRDIPSWMQQNDRNPVNSKLLIYPPNINDFRGR